MGNKKTDYLKEIEEKLVHLTRLALSGRRQDVLMLTRRITKLLHANNRDAAEAMLAILRDSPTESNPLRGELSPVPVDRDSRLQLVRVENPVEISIEPIWIGDVARQLEQVTRERAELDALNRAGLEPSRTLMFTGLPGVGKTLAARWLAKKLNRPLLILDLSAVMSSFLGRTGTNLRFVLDYAKSMDCVLLLDEFDSIAKRRDDSVEVGELKRLVTVLLQEIDDWPSSGILISATNHPELLDRAVWRRFDLKIDFPVPQIEHIEGLVRRLLVEWPIKPSWHLAVAVVCQGESFSDIVRDVARVKREAIVQKVRLETQLQQMIQVRVGKLRPNQRIELAVHLVNCGLSQREANRITSVSRDTIRKVALNAD